MARPGFRLRSESAASGCSMSQGILLRPDRPVCNSAKLTGFNGIRGSIGCAFFVWGITASGARMAWADRRDPGGG